MLFKVAWWRGPGARCRDSGCQGGEPRLSLKAQDTALHEHVRLQTKIFNKTRLRFALKLKQLKVTLFVRRLFNIKGKQYFLSREMFFTFREIKVGYIHEM